MFFSLNKKIIYSLIGFLILVTFLFLMIFINLYSQKAEENQNTIFIRNEYVVKLLYDNIRLQKRLAQIGKEYPQVLDKFNISTLSKELDTTQQQLTNEQKLNDELKKNYNNNKEAVKTGAQVIGYSFFVVILFILLLMVLLDRWVIQPTERVSDVSRQVSSGIYSSRLPTHENDLFQDEFDILYTAYNQMLDSLEKNIEDVKNREKFLQQLIDAIPEGIRVIDKNYNVIMTNKAFNEFFKTAESSAEHKCYQAYGYKCDGCPSSKYNCPIKVIKDGNDSLRTIHEVGKVPFYLNAAKLMISSKDYYIIEALHDLSRDIRYSHQQKVASLGFLSTSIAHEMKNNLGAIRMILEGILSDEYKNITNKDSVKRYLTMAYEQLVETVKTPERLLRLAQYSEDEITVIDVKSAVEDMLLMIDYDAKRRGISIMTAIERNLILNSNEADFKMVILNLIQNAIKAMPDGGLLNIEGTQNTRNIIINIRDTGVGIDAKKIKHIFEPFYSANNQVRSSGLGLAIVNSLIEKNKGSISVKSKIGKGTDFTIKYPKNKKRL